MKKLSGNNYDNKSINDGVFISTTSYPKNSNPREFTIEWNKGSEKIVGMIEKVLDKTPTKTTIMQKTPFKPQYVFSISDEQSMFDENKPPMKLWWAAQDYQNWISNECKGEIPDLKEAVDNLCSGRLVLSIGLGGYIFCELNSDAKKLIEYYNEVI